MRLDPPCARALAPAYAAEAPNYSGTADVAALADALLLRAIQDQATWAAEAVDGEAVMAMFVALYGDAGDLPRVATTLDSFETTFGVPRPRRRGGWGGGRVGVGGGGGQRQHGGGPGLAGPVATGGPGDPLLDRDHVGGGLPQPRRDAGWSPPGADQA